MAAAKINLSLFECGLCLNVFEDPRNLPCGHTYCFKCTKQLIATNKNDQPSCAICRKSWTVPVEGLRGLMKNYVLNNFVQSFGQQTDSVIVRYLTMETNMDRLSTSVLIAGTLFVQIALRCIRNLN